MHIRGFFDFDYTLYDTRKLIAFLTGELVNVGCTPEDIQRHIEMLVPRGYSFEQHFELLGIAPTIRADLLKACKDRLKGGDEFLYPGVPESLQRLKGSELILLTFGFPNFQQMKYHGTPVLHPHMTDAKFVWQDETKGDVIKAYGPHPNTWFVDDSPSHLLDTLAKAPWTHCVRIRWEGTNFAPHTGDGHLWPVVTDLEAFIRLVEAG